jgi:endonuclease/exonuclease/phosphatase family metal-dependent hydrolase
LRQQPFGGLVGDMRRIRLLTYNIAHARGLGLHQSLRSRMRIRSQLRRIAALIQRLEADVVALQEIDENSRWNGSFDHLAYLSEHTGLPFAVHGVNNRRNHALFHANYGNAVLARFPIAHHENLPFGRQLLGEKGVLFAEVDTPAGRLPVVNVHMHHRSRASRLKQAAHLMEFLSTQRRARGAAWRTGPIVCGDLNNPAHTPDATAMLLGYFEQFDNYQLVPKGAGGVPLRTFPSLWPARALDYIYLPSQCQRVEVTVVRSYLSDHRPVLAEFQLASEQ